MLLGSSSDAVDTAADPTAVMADGTGDGGVPHGEALLAFTTAVHRLDHDLPDARRTLTDAVGVSGMIDAAVTAAVFRGLNIAADTSGIRVDEPWEPIAADLMERIGTGRFRTAANSPAVGG
jgi:hypothetical protein